MPVGFDNVRRRESNISCDLRESKGMMANIARKQQCCILILLQDDLIWVPRHGYHAGAIFWIQRR